MPGITNLSDLVERYFSSNIWLIVFIVSVLYLFIRFNIGHKRAFLGALAFLFLFANEIVIRWYTALGQNGSFYRHLWAIPSMAIIGIAIIDIIRLIPKWILRIPVVALFAVGLWFVNQLEYIRCRDQNISPDAKMVQEEVIELNKGFEELRKKATKQPIYVVCPTGYNIIHGDMPTELNLYCGYLSIINSTLLNDSEHNGEIELMDDSPDVSHIMSTCCANGIDYVIVSRNEETEKIFSEHGYKAAFKTGSYMVIQCSGYPGFLQEENKWGRIIKKTYYDEYGNPDRLAAGYSAILYSYDGKMNLIKEEYINENGILRNNELGYAIREYKYTVDGKKTYAAYLDSGGAFVQSSIYDFHDYLLSLRREGITVIISIRDEGTAQLSEQNIKDLQYFGIKADFKNGYRNSYIAVITDNGTCEKMSSDSIQYQTKIDSKNIMIISKGILVGDESSIIIDNVEYSVNSRGMNIVVYDNDLGEVIDSVCFDTHFIGPEGMQVIRKSF